MALRFSSGRSVTVTERLEGRGVGITDRIAAMWQPWGGSGLSSRNAADNRDPSKYVGKAGLQIAPVFGAVSLIAGGASTSDVVVSEERERITEGLPMWADENSRPNTVQSQTDLFDHIATSKLVGGNAFIKIISRRDDNYPDSVESLNPAEVKIPLEGKYRFEYQDKTYKPYSRANINGDILHLRLMTIGGRYRGVSPLEVAAPPLRVALAAEATAELYFAAGGMPPSVLVFKNAAPDSDGVDEVIEHYKEVRRRPEMAYVPLALEGDVQWLSTYIAPEQAQLLDSRKFSWHAASALYGVHPILLGAPGTATLSGYREVQRSYRELTLTRFLRKIGKGMTELLPPVQRLTLKPEYMLRLEPLEQARWHERYLNMGVLYPSDILSDLGRPPREGIDERYERLYTSGGTGEDSDSSLDSGTNLDGPEGGGE